MIRAIVHWLLRHRVELVFVESIGVGTYAAHYYCKKCDHQWITYGDAL